ncbi:MAG: RNA polymerase sigma factor [Clostridia bacterium]|nr:RNA polymerase sigma factor [Clostridia bacterium]
MKAEKRGGTNGFLSSSCSENTLIKKSKNGDKQAFEYLMNHHLKVIYNYICLHVSNSEDVKDIIQESMLSIWMSVKNYNFQSSFKTWIIGIVRRRIADHYRKLYKNQTISISGFEETLVKDDESDNIISGLDIEKVLEKLSKIEKEIVFLSFTVQLTYLEISKIIHIPVGTIKRKMSRIKTKLRKQLQEEGEGIVKL